MTKYLDNIKKSILLAFAISLVLGLVFYLGVNLKTRLDNSEQFNLYVYSDTCLDQNKMISEITDIIPTKRVTVDYGTSNDKMAITAFSNSHVLVLSKSYLELVAVENLFLDVSFLNGEKYIDYKLKGVSIGIKVFDTADTKYNKYMLNDYFNFTEEMYLVILEKNYYTGLEIQIKAFLGE